MRLTQRSSNIRISSGVKDLDDMCGGSYFKIPLFLPQELLVQVRQCLYQNLSKMLITIMKDNTVRL